MDKILLDYLLTGHVSLQHVWLHLRYEKKKKIPLIDRSLVLLKKALTVVLDGLNCFEEEE